VNPNISGVLLRALLHSGHAFVRPDRILSDLSDEAAHAVPVGAERSIAQLVAHMAHWQRHCLRRIESRGEVPAQVGNDWPPVSVGSWSAILEDFLGSLEAMRDIASSDDALGEQYADRTEDVGTVLADFALHNAYHFGQIVSLRKALGVWPPSGYDPETW
jgi:uncharacterized damage-inducible protein DinB